MDLFTRFNRKNIDDRQIDTLIGISKVPIADPEKLLLRGCFRPNSDSRKIQMLLATHFSSF